MSVSSMSTALILYTPAKTPMEFIKSEVEKGMSNRLIPTKQTIPRSIPPYRFTALSAPGISLKKPQECTSIIYQSKFPLGAMCNGIDFSLDCAKSCEDVEKLLNTTILDRFDRVQSPSCLSYGSSGKKLNGNEIAETLQAEASFTIGTDKKPIVATYGCGPCVALGGYDAINKMAFIVHFSSAGEVRKSGGLILYNIYKLVKEKITTPIQLHLRGGVEGISEPIIEAIKIWMKTREDLPMEIASEDVLKSTMSLRGKSLSVDSRTGAVSEYNPMDNPNSRGISDVVKMSALRSAFNPKIKVAYSPQ